MHKDATTLGCCKQLEERRQIGLEQHTLDVGMCASCKFPRLFEGWCRTPSSFYATWISASIFLHDITHPKMKHWNAASEMLLPNFCGFVYYWSTWSSFYPLIAAPTVHGTSRNTLSKVALWMPLHGMAICTGNWWMWSPQNCLIKVVTRSEFELSVSYGHRWNRPRQLQATWLSGVMSCHRWTLQCSALSDFIRKWTRYKRYEHNWAICFCIQMWHKIPKLTGVTRHKAALEATYTLEIAWHDGIWVYTALPWYIWRMYPVSASRILEVSICAELSISFYGQHFMSTRWHERFRGLCGVVI